MSRYHYPLTGFSREPSLAMIGRRLLIPVVCVLLGACGKSLGGYPYHENTPTLVGPTTSSHDDKTVYMDLIRQMQQQGAYYASLAHIDAYKQRFGTTAELKRRQADALRETDQWEAARSIYLGLLGSDQAAAAWHGLGLIAVHDGQDDQADQALLKASQLEPVNAAYLSDLGYARLCAGRFAAARDPLAMAAELEPANSKVIANLALWALLNGDAVRADAIMQRGSLPPSSRDDIHRLAVQMASRKPSISATTKPVSHTTSSPVNSSAQGADVPAGMLQRFTSSTANYEARP
jgi:Flp pilus assembly protein TadD